MRLGQRTGERREKMKQAERREKTRVEIERAFMALVSERGFDRVSVKDICQRADVNRNTFYLHYMDKDDLARTLLDRMMMAQIGALAEEASTMSQESPERIEEIVRRMLGMLYADRQFYRVFLTDEGLSRHVRPLQKLACHMVEARASRPVSEVALDYIISGVVGVLTTFLSSHGRTVDEIAPGLARLLWRSFEELHTDPGAHVTVRSV